MPSSAWVGVRSSINEKLMDCFHCCCCGCCVHWGQRQISAMISTSSLACVRQTELSCYASVCAVYLLLLAVMCVWHNEIMKKALGETQTLRAGCSKAEKKFSPRRRTPFRGAQDGQNLISLRWSLPPLTNPVWWRSTHAISSYHSNRPMHKPARYRHDWWQYTVSQSLARSVIMN